MQQLCAQVTATLFRQGFGPPILIRWIPTEPPVIIYLKCYWCNQYGNGFPFLMYYYVRVHGGIWNLKVLICSWRYSNSPVGEKPEVRGLKNCLTVGDFQSSVVIANRMTLWHVLSSMQAGVVNTPWRKWLWYQSYDATILVLFLRWKH